MIFFWLTKTKPETKKLTNEKKLVKLKISKADEI
jgi:hypothetical protein